MPSTYVSEYLGDFFVPTEWEIDRENSFGLQTPPGGWEAFQARIEELKIKCGANESIKVIYAARHGEAEHNVLGKTYGYDEANERFPYIDPPLTGVGKQQAASLERAFQRESGQNMPEPSIWFVSPLRRCGETMQEEWGWLCDKETGSSAIPAQVVESLREHMILHSWNSYESLTKSKSLFPHFVWPKEMEEGDTMYQTQFATGSEENEEELLARTRGAVNQILTASKGHTYISVTSHSGALRGVWAALGVPKRPLKEGEMNVLVVKVRETSEA